MLAVIALVVLSRPGYCDVSVVTSPNASSLEKQVAHELAVILHRIYPGEQFIFVEKKPLAGKCILVGCATEPLLSGGLGGNMPKEAESYVVARAKEGDLDTGLIAGADVRGVAYGAYALLRKLGCGFYISGDALPAAKTEAFSFAGWELTDKPLVKDRLVFNWHNFLSGCSTWNLPEWKSWILQSQKQGYNAVMVHAYGNNPMAGFTFNGKAKPVGYLSTTVRGRDWATMHVNDVRKLCGGEVFTGAVFGADAAMGPEEQRSADAVKLMSDVFAYAGERAMDVYFAVDVDTESANPQELIKSLPESARFAVKNGKLWLADPESPEGFAFYKAEVAELLKVYPQITWLTVWFRRGNEALTLEFGEMPIRWQEEYKAQVLKVPGAEKFYQSHKMFVMGKITRAFERALKELGHDRVQLAAGSWNFGFLPAADLFFPRQIKFIGLDYDVLDDKSVFAAVGRRAKLAEVGAHRALIPVIWAHHDDGNYIGRPYTPFEGFSAKLAESKAGGFGIIHWTTRPLDIFFDNHALQVWQGTKAQPLRKSCDEMAGKLFGPMARESMGAYLERWVSDAPKFARETEARFIDHPMANVEKVVAGCQDRLKLIEQADLAKITPEQRDRVGYYKGMEEFIAEFYRTQEQFQNAESFYKAGEVVKARACMAECRPEKVIEKFARTASLGGITRGEQGLVVSMNTRWLSHYVRLRQALGMEAVRYKFGPTSHDKLAQAAGKFTFHFDASRHMWQTLGAEEMGARIFTLPVETKIMRGAGLPAEYEEICRSGMESDKPVNITIRPIMKAGKLLKGDYQIRLIMVDPGSTAEGQSVFKVSAGDGADVDIFKKTGGASRILELVYQVKVGDSGELVLTLTPVTGKVVLSGLVLELEK